VQTLNAEFELNIKKMREEKAVVSGVSKHFVASLLARGQGKRQVDSLKIKSTKLQQENKTL